MKFYHNMTWNDSLNSSSLASIKMERAESLKRCSKQGSQYAIEKPNPLYIQQ